MNNSYEIQFLQALSMTLVVEIPVIICFVRFFFKLKEINLSKVIFVGFLASTLTLPYLWFVLPAFVSDRNLFFYGGETLVVLIEVIIYQQLLKLGLKRAFIVSLIANSASIIVGLCIF